MRTTQEIRPLSPREIGDLLAVLELREMPDRPLLQKHFSRLLKRYHPDRNRERSDWAHEKTRAIIAANHRLRKFLDSQPAINITQNFGAARPAERPAAYKVKTYTGWPTASPAAAPPGEAADFSGTPSAADGTVGTPATGGGFPVQLVRSGLGNFALPVLHLERILAFDADQVTSLVPGEFVFLYNSEVYRIYDLNGDRPPLLPRDSYLILFTGTRGRFALLADSKTEFASIEECTAADLRRSFLEGAGDLQLFFQTERFIFPASLRRLL